MSVPSPQNMETAAAACDFIGRDDELDRIVTALLGPSRLVTLVGAGGIGKTRLAVEVTRRLRKARRAPVYWVRLSRLAKDSAPAAVADEVVRSVVDGDFSGRSAWRALIETLGAGQRFRGPAPVLVVDNCEHLLDAAGDVICRLIAEVPGLTVLATSRETIGWIDEQRIVIPPLAHAHAVDLFRQRAALTGRPVADEHADLVDSICGQVHHHPLYIQLAAARLRYQPLPLILRDLGGTETDRRLHWSGGPRLGLDERHRGIRDVIAWSFDLCEPKEQLLFERMSVFAAGYDVHPDDADGRSTPDTGAELSAITAVCADDEPAGLLAREIEPLLERLVDRSLVLIHLDADLPRYSLLESCRVFAQQRLAERDAAAWARLTGRHLRHYRDRASAARAEWADGREAELLTWARAAWDNLLCAIDRSQAGGDGAAGLEIAIGLIALRVPFLRGSLRESRQLAERTLATVHAAGAGPVAARVSARAMIGWIALCQGLADEAERTLDECVAELDPDPEVAARWRRQPTADAGFPAAVEYLWGSVLLLDAADVRALPVLTRARSKFTADGDRGGAIMAELFEALAAGFLGTAEQAIDITARHLAGIGDSGPQWAKSWAELARAIALTAHGDAEEAASLIHAALSWQLDMRDRWGVLWAVHIRCWMLARMITDGTGGGRAARERAREIGWLGGGAAALRREMGVDLANLRPFATATDRALVIARKTLGDREFEVFLREGELLNPTTNEVARLALGTWSPQRIPTDHPVRQHRPAPWQQLSAAEREVAVLAAAGWTNAAIATRRGSSSRTVDAQVAAVLHKLMIRSRAEILPLLPDADRARADREAAAPR
ncbi:AAA family ATPase [Nocardia otitidiscaviarum]|uniref:ATP-binding protein n=1 Tax=Nocardia otitidiscaviarum TaxID=1823 RepID=UPI0011DDBADE|nr:AAA family ATPase [Nocardia otitidiscaviarum]MBF6136320.1 AAA family ATPase [Nocardia otitidiscaviarum]MBF6484522.1 AAA family ATPase [Nocardia otitidiscaviarum]